MKQLHQKIKELQLRAAPITMSGSYVDGNGNLQQVDLKLDASANDRTVRGYLTVWNVIDSYGTVMVKGCFSRSIRERGPLSASKQKIAHLWQHNTDEPTGQFTVLKEDDYGLYFEALIDDIPQGERELRQVRSGTINQFSVGFNYMWDKMEYDETADVIVIHEAELMEGSAVTFGSNAETYAFRSIDQLYKDKENLLEETEDFIKSLPRTKQLELRQLITRHISLSAIKPDAAPLELDKTDKNVVVIGGYKLNVNEFKQ